MDTKQFVGLMEAYSEVYAPQEELDEASRRDEFTRAAIARNSGRKGGITFEPGPNWDPSANRGRGAHLNPKQKEKQRRKALRQEELDIFDVVLEFLQVEGFAETLEEAEWMMANQLDSEDINAIVEAMCEDDEEDDKEMKKGKKSKKSEEDEDDEEEDDLKEASYSAKAARAGKDIGKPGKQFAKIAKEAGKRYGSKERGEKVAGAVLARIRAKKG